MLSSCAVATAELPTVGKPQPLVVRLGSSFRTLKLHEGLTVAKIRGCYPA